MFFILSKLFGVLIKPLNLMVLLGLYCLFTKNNRRKQRGFKLLVIALIFFSNPLIINQLTFQWETGRRSPVDITTPYDVGILLGGYTQTSAATPPGTLSFFRGDRLTTTISLYKTGKIRHVLLSGGSGKLIGGDVPEAQSVRQYLLDIGVPDSAIWMDDRSRSTRENACYSKIVLDSLMPDARCLLITSAWHLRRAHPCFLKAGIACDVFGTDYLSEQSNGNPFNWIEPDWKALMKWESLIKEWIGYAAYRAKGYI